MNEHSTSKNKTRRNLWVAAAAICAAGLIMFIPLQERERKLRLQQSANMHLRQAIGEFHDKKYDQAVAEYSQVIELEPNAAYLYLSRALANERLQQYDLAINDYNKAIELEPALAVAYQHRATTYGSLKQFDKQRNDADRAIELDPTLKAAYAIRADANEKLGRSDLAQRDLATIKSLNTSKKTEGKPSN